LLYTTDMSTEEPDTTIASRGHSTNLVGLPTGLLASASFNDFPIPLCISGTRESHRSLFERLDKLTDAVEAGRIFQDYMAVVFGLDMDSERGEPEKNERRRFRASYLRLLKDWGFDSNSPAWIHYVEEKMSSRFNNNTINMQFDLLYEFCQWALLRFHATGKKHLLLYRGTNDLREQQLIQQLDARNAIVRLNNLVSFTSRRGIADEFGDIIIEAEVPVTKLLFFNDLLSGHPLRGEAECLVIGGDYRVKMSYW